MTRLLLAIAIFALAGAIAFLAFAILDDDDDISVVSDLLATLVPSASAATATTVPAAATATATTVPEPTAPSAATPLPTTTTVEPVDIPPAEITGAGTAVQLTHTTTGAFDPAWDPAGETIALLSWQSGACANRCSDIGSVQADGTGEGFIATGPQRDIGIAGSLSWIGSTGLLMTNERIFFHEYMSVDTALAPFVRTALDGADAAFKTMLVIPGGSGGDAIDVSRDGSTVAWRHRQGTQVPVTLRVAPVDSLNGQNTDAHGTVLLTDSADPAAFALGIALSPDGSQIVVSLVSGEGNDLFLYSTDGPGEPVQLTDTGASAGALNRGPSFSPDGDFIAFYQSDGAQNDLWLLSLADSLLTRLTSTDDFSEANPTWAPDGKRIAFQGAAPGGVSDIYMIELTVD